jgi:hypothetical protein
MDHYGPLWTITAYSFDGPPDTDIIAIMYISLEKLVLELRLPKSFLQELIERREIPFLVVHGRLRFDLQAVREALADMATRPGGDHDDK